MRSRIITRRLRAAAIVTLKSGEAFRGALWEVDQLVLVLRNAEHIQPKSDVPTMPVDGEIVLWVADIAYVQLTAVIGG